MKRERPRLAQAASHGERELDACETTCVALPGDAAPGCSALGGHPAVRLPPPAGTAALHVPHRHAALPPHIAGAMARRPALLQLLLLCAVAAGVPRVRACTSVLVGKACTDDGSWYIARTVDFELGNITCNLL